MIMKNREAQRPIIKFIAEVSPSTEEKEASVDDWTPGYVEDVVGARNAKFKRCLRR